VRQPDARREHWNGHTLTLQEASAASGIEKVLFTSGFEDFLSAALSVRRRGCGASRASPSSAPSSRR
jgi:hypothetical protein